MLAESSEGAACIDPGKAAERSRSRDVAQHSEPKAKTDDDDDQGEDDDQGKDNADADPRNDRRKGPETDDGETAEEKEDDLPASDKAGEHGPDDDMDPEPPLRRSARLRGQPPPPTVTEEVLADISRSHLLLLTLLSGRK